MILPLSIALIIVFPRSMPRETEHAADESKSSNFRNVQSSPASMESALESTLDGTQANLALGGMTPGLTTDGQANLIGRGIYAPVTFLPDVLPSTDLLTISPPDDGNVREMTQVSNLVLVANGGRHALHLNLTGEGRRMSRFEMTRVLLRSSSAAALKITNELDERDAFFTSVFTNSTIDGGVEVFGGGDSITFEDITFTGKGRIVFQLNTIERSGADASQLLISGCNFTNAGGLYIMTGTRVRIVNNNMELGSKGQGVGNALVYLQGGETGEEIEGATVAGNYLAPITPSISALRLGATNGTQIYNNTISAPYKTPGLRIDGNAKNTIIGPNIWETTPGFEVDDQGMGTMGIYKTLYLEPSRQVTAGRPPVRFIKKPNGLHGTVTLSGSLNGGTTQKDATLGVLPVGFRPSVTDTFTVQARTVEGLSQVQIIIEADTGRISLAEELSVPLLELSFNGVSFEASNVI